MTTYSILLEADDERQRELTQSRPARGQPLFRLATARSLA